jgi:LCCL domain
MSLLSVTRKSVAIVLLAGCVLGVLAACSSSGDIEISSKQATTTTEAADTTTTSQDDATTTTDSSEGVSTTAVPGVGDGMGGTTTPGATGAADEDAAEVTWSTNVGPFVGRNGLKVAFVCPPSGTVGSLWGSGPFTDDSSVCTAAAYAGLITLADGGRVVIQITPGEEAYAAGEANGITAQSYGPWRGSFIFP